MQVVRINISGPIRIGPKVGTVGSPRRGLAGTMAWSDLQRCNIVARGKAAKSMHGSSSTM